MNQFGNDDDLFGNRIETQRKQNYDKIEKLPKEKPSFPNMTWKIWFQLLTAAGNSTFFPCGGEAGMARGGGGKKTLVSIISSVKNDALGSRSGI